ncbi:hypothetical protein VDG1235_1539 [Verrucomicrobiia bacterium DG1235]|nr:hypothetical protein VDG1235_1539 [Verrucomicrobiae bacterium DG1235]
MATVACGEAMWGDQIAFCGLGFVSGDFWRFYSRDGHSWMHFL